MTDRLLVATDLDRTLIPNGPEPESKQARTLFTALVSRAEVSLAYVSGRHRDLIEEAIGHYDLAPPDHVIGDVGTSIYHVDSRGEWQHWSAWEEDIARDWRGRRSDDLASLLHGVGGLRLQERARQNRCKLSYYVSLGEDRGALFERIQARLEPAGIRARLIWSEDEAVGLGFLDILPRRASKLHALEALMEARGFDDSNTVFCGDSGNDLEVLVSPIPAVLVANSQPGVKVEARARADSGGHAAALYIANGGFLGMNGNYSAGMLEGIAHFHPHTVEWLPALPGGQP
jgi:HAD superfamily hydrolase (TIGR01484 family)